MESLKRLWKPSEAPAAATGPDATQTTGSKSLPAAPEPPRIGVTSVPKPRDRGSLSAIEQSVGQQLFGVQDRLQASAELQPPSIGLHDKQEANFAEALDAFKHAWPKYSALIQSRDSRDLGKALLASEAQGVDLQRFVNNTPITKEEAGVLGRAINRVAEDPKAEAWNYAPAAAGAVLGTGLALAAPVSIPMLLMLAGGVAVNMATAGTLSYYVDQRERRRVDNLNSQLDSKMRKEQQGQLANVAQTIPDAARFEAMLQDQSKDPKQMAAKGARVATAFQNAVETLQPRDYEEAVKQPKPLEHLVATVRSKLSADAARKDELLRKVNADSLEAAMQTRDPRRDQMLAQVQAAGESLSKGGDPKVHLAPILKMLPDTALRGQAEQALHNRVQEILDSGNINRGTLNDLSSQVTALRFKQLESILLNNPDFAAQLSKSST